MEVAEQWGSLPLGRRAVIPVLSRLEQGGRCELGDKGQRTDRQSLPGHVGGESDTTGFQGLLLGRQNVPEGREQMPGHLVLCASLVGPEPQEEGREGWAEAGEQPGQAQRSGSGFAEKSPDFWRKGNAAQVKGRLSCGTQVGFRMLSFP